ncbi:MAG: DUF2909 domain-containing protein [Burkholderiales bacterium]|nr:twin transmembrane helix small protein [Burkholderiales bacterium]MDE1927841.1 DUF2909 domain-containing protein [Burkholderiales bacterium]MDE2503314.1 DUF2909 domain-containing protein [Burkholderiales bacterium]
MKSLMVVLFMGVLAALASAGLFMLRKGNDADRGKRMARALAVRVGLSIALFLLILLSWYMGWIRPNGVPLGS